MNYALQLKWKLIRSPEWYFCGDIDSALKSNEDIFTWYYSSSSVGAKIALSSYKPRYDQGNIYTFMINASETGATFQFNPKTFEIPDDLARLPLENFLSYVSCTKILGRVAEY
jgi:hypothetical protein